MDTLSIGAFAFGVTQIIKDSGYVQGRALQAVAVVAGCLATYFSLYQPELWIAISKAAVALGLTAGVSFIDERTGNR